MIRVDDEYKNQLYKEHEALAAATGRPMSFVEFTRHKAQVNDRVITLLDRIVAGKLLQPPSNGIKEGVRLQVDGRYNSTGYRAPEIPDLP